MTNPPQQQVRPLVLIPGLLAGTASLIPMQSGLRSEHAPSKIAKLPKLNVGCMENGSRLLAQQVLAVCERHGVERCALVGTSLGGLLGLYAAKRLLPAGLVETLVAVGTPFQGTNKARVGAVLGNGHAVAQLHTGSDFIRELHADGPIQGTRCVSIAGREDLFSPPEACRLAGAEHLVLSGFPKWIAHQYMVVSPRVCRTIKSALLGL